VIQLPTKKHSVLGGNKKFWGNLTSKALLQTPAPPACSGENLSVTADTHNWIHASGTDYQYDAAGNMTFNATAPTQTYTYDQENRLTGAAGYNYTYDCDGNRVRKSGGSTGTLYWYMTPGIVAESDLSGTLKSEYVFFDGERVARKDFLGNAIAYYFSDNLKTASVITDSAGVIKADSDYYPWGGELQFVKNDSNHYKFTGKERDSETQLDYFGARYYSNGLGRWVSADWSPMPIPVPYADFGDPQSLNLYGYVRNIPTSKVDPNGHSCPPCVDEEVIELILEHPQAAAAIVAAAEKTGEVVAKAAKVGGEAAVSTLGVVVFLLSASQKTAPPKSDELHPDSEKQIQQTSEPAAASGGASQGGGGFRYENPGHHDPTSPNFVPEKTPLPTDAESVFGTAIPVTGRAPGTGELSYGLSETGQYYRYSGQNGVLHYSGTIQADKVPKDIRKQLQEQAKEEKNQ
jgi:RHS repeat-associated protein